MDDLQQNTWEKQEQGMPLTLFTGPLGIGTYKHNVECKTRRIVRK